MVDGDTLKVLLNEEEETLRLIAIDTEEFRPGSSKPVTQAGLLAAEIAKQHFRAASGDLVQVDIEFDPDDPVAECLIKHRGNYGRLLCYVHKQGENFNLKLIKEGWSPYFIKYGRSTVYHEAMTKSEAEAQSNNFGIWDPITNRNGPRRDYDFLLP